MSARLTPPRPGNDFMDDFENQSPSPFWGRTLAALSENIAASQSALLTGSLKEFNHRIARQAGLCSELRALIQSNPTARAGCAQVRLQALILKAVLRKVRQNLAALQNALGGQSLTYRRNYPSKTGTSGRS
jgi:hypothetical protein